MDRRIKFKAQLYRDDEIAMGPGKAALLVAISETGSISAAGRKLGMSYRRAWLLVDAMNRGFSEPLVATSPQGATVTSFGLATLAEYHALNEAMTALEHSSAGQALLRRLR